MTALVTHKSNTDCLNRQQRCERLADLIIQARRHDFLDENIIRLPRSGGLLFAQDSSCDSRTGERVPDYEIMWDAGITAQPTHFVFEEIAQGLSLRSWPFIMRSGSPPTLCAF
jgi:hypothetical protein